MATWIETNGLVEMPQFGIIANSFSSPSAFGIKFAKHGMIEFYADCIILYH